MLDMGTARMRAGATTCRGGAIAGRIIGAGVTTRRAGAIAARSLEFGTRYGRVRQGRQ